MNALTPAQAARVILEHVAPLAPARVPLLEALDRVLAETVTSPIDLPAWDNSAMDGYAARAADVRGATRAAPRTLRGVETVPAGRFPTRALRAGEAAGFSPGAPPPAGADSVIRQEDTTAAGDAVRVLDDRDAQRNLRKKGEDIRAGDVVVAAGSALGPAQLGVLASIAYAQPLVYGTPRVAFLGSGDEIADMDQREEILAGKKIATSNSYTLFGMITRAGAVPVNAGVALDTKDSLREHFARARGADLIVTTAGVSVGEHDLGRDVLAELGCDLKVERVQMRPGAPLGFGLIAGRAWLGLPGNPVSTMVTFELFVRPAIRRMQGHTLPFRRTVAVTMAEPITLGPKLRHYLRAVVTDAPNGTRSARLTGPQGSGILTSMVRANALVIVPEDRPTVAAGEPLAAILLDDPQHVAAAPY